MPTTSICLFCGAEIQVPEEGDKPYVDYEPHCCFPYNDNPGGDVGGSGFYHNG